MSDFPPQFEIPDSTVINCFEGTGRCPGGDLLIFSSSQGAAAVWPAANRAIFVPFTVNSTVTATQMTWVVSVQSGNYDMGIYDVNAVRLVSVGSTAVPAAGLAAANIADTVLTPGVYFMALCIDNTTASTLRSSTGTVGALSCLGIQDQDVGAVTLPNPATLSAMGAVYVPFMAVHLVATV